MSNNADPPGPRTGNFAQNIVHRIEKDRTMRTASSTPKLDTDFPALEPVVGSAGATSHVGLK
jgi:hypothetical protein